jgi:DNA-binding transcriptional LysR family regulator
MKISYFREFLVLTKLLNFSIAAKQLNMTQPGLSRHISKLENEVGAKLFERDTHRVTLSSQGERFLEGIQKIVDDYDVLCKEVAVGGGSKLTIGAPYYGIRKYLSLIMSSFEDAYPEITIRYFPSYPDEIITRLFSKQVDVAVMPKVNFDNADRIVFHEAYDESLVLLLNRRHRLAEKDRVRMAEIEDECFLNLKGSWGDALFKSHIDYCRQNDLKPPQSAAVQPNTIEEAALGMKPDSGVMILPGHLKEANIADGVKCLRILDEEFYLTVCLLRNPENKNPIIDKFINFYLRECPNG